MNSNISDPAEVDGATTAIPSGSTACTAADAIALARVGYRVFPLVHWRNGQVSPPKNWPERATRDPQEIDALWQMPPGAVVVSIGLATGFDYSVIDVDEKGGKSGSASLREANITLPPTLTVTTESGGKHYFYRTVGGERGTVSDVAYDGGKLMGVDIRGRGGYVKVHDLETLLSNTAIAATPGWVPFAGSRSPRAGRGPEFFNELAAREHENWGASPPMTPDLEQVVQHFRDGSPNIGHETLLTLTYDLALLIGEGHPGAAQAIAEARSAYVGGASELRKDWAREFDNALLGSTQLRLPARRLPPSTAMSAHNNDERETAGHGSGTWVPVNVGRVLDGLLNGSLQHPQPTVLHRRDGAALLYAGRVNGVHGESGSGKTWTALLACAEAIERGEAALYLDYEDSAPGVIGRLVSLGIDTEAIRSQFIYLNPEGRFDVAAVQNLVLEHRPVVTVLDSVGEALAAESSSPNDDDDVARWFASVPRPIARLGPAVLVLDHVPKSTDERSKLQPIGSQRKRAAIDGVQYLQEVVRPFSRTAEGRARLICAKDREGTYTRSDTIAELYVAPGDDRVVIELLEPHGNLTLVDRDVEKRKAIITYVEGCAEPPSQSTVANWIGGRKEDVVRLLKSLVEAGDLVAKKSGRARTYSLPQPVPERDDDASA